MPARESPTISQPRRGVRVDWALVGILLVALALRLYGLAWDEGLLFHPDERQIYMQVDQLAFPWPPSAAELLSPDSPWNPRFFAYGSLPLYTLRIVTWLLGLIDPALAGINGFFWSGRALSALLDVGSVALVYAMGKRLFGRAAGLLGAALLALAVLHIQLSHFYAVDTMLACLAMLTLFLALRAAQRLSIARGAVAGLAFGLAIATKASAGPLALPLAVAWFLGDGGQGPDHGAGAYRFWWRVGGLAVTLACAAVAMAAAQPYAVIDPFRFLTDVIHEGRMASGAIDVPYTRQYAGTIPYLYHLRQLLIWSLGVPLGVAGLTGMALQVGLVFRGFLAKERDRAAALLVPLSWCLVYVAAVGGLHAKFARYMLPITPLLCLWAGHLLWRAWGLRAQWARVLGRVAGGAVIVATALYALVYLRVYAQTHPWIEATRYICETVPSGSIVVVEHWDDPLPLTQHRTGPDACYTDLNVFRFPAYDADTRDKAYQLLAYLQSADYIVLSTHRLYGTIPRLPERYPLTSRYYRALMAEELGFELVHLSTAYPGLAGVELVDDTFDHVGLPMPALMAEAEASRCALNLGMADESFTVYDHPKPLVFRRTVALSRAELEQALGLAEITWP